MCILFSDGRESNVPQCTAFPPKTHTTALRWLTSETKTAISTLVPHCHSLWLTKQNTRANIGSSALIQKSGSCNVYSKYFLAIYKLCVTNEKKKNITNSPKKSPFAMLRQRPSALKFFDIFLFIFLKSGFTLDWKFSFSPAVSVILLQMISTFFIYLLKHI